MTFFPEIMSIFTPTHFDDLFFSHRPEVFQILRFFTVLNAVYYPFFTKKHYFRKEFLDKTIFSSVRTFALIRQHYFSKYWGDQCMGRPPPQILGGTAPPTPPPHPPPPPS